MPLRASAGAVAAAAVVATAAIAGGRRIRAVRRLPAELRHPLLYLPLGVRNRCELWLWRRMPLRTGVVSGVTCARRAVAASAPTRDVPVFVYEPEDRARPSAALLWIHGGGLVLGSAEADHELCSTIARQLGMVVVSVEYRLAPEEPFPAGLDDCYAALQWLGDTARTLGVDPARIAVGGASAGGGLAAAVAQQALDRAEIPIAFQLLEYPMLDDRTTRRPADGTGRFGHTATSNRFAWTCYLGRRSPSGEAPAYAAPARRADPAGLPPTWIGVGELDLFYGEDTTFARRLRDAGGHCELDVVAGMYHGADNLTRTAETVVAFRSRMIGALARALAPVGVVAPADVSSAVDDA